MDTTERTIPDDVDCTIFIVGNRARVTGTYPVKVVKEATSYMVEGYRFSPAYKRKVWDGRKHFLNKGAEMPSGLVQTVVNALYKYNPAGKVQIVYESGVKTYTSASGMADLVLNGIEFGKGEYDYQLHAAEVAVEKQRGILKLATNAGKTEIACAITKWLCLPTLFLVTSRDLMHQTQKRFAKRLDVPEDEIGVIGDGECSIGKRLPSGTSVTVATVQTLLNREIDLTQWDVVFADECHQVGSDDFYNLLDKLPAFYRYGLSGTPLDRSDGADLRLIAQTGEIIYEVPNKLLIERGISVQPHIELVTVDKPKLPKRGLTYPEVYAQAITENPVHNNLVVDKAVEYVKQGLNVVIMVELRKHGELIHDLLTARSKKLKHRYIHGDEDTDARSKALEDLSKKKINCLITTKILDQGIDTPAIDVLILAGGGKAKIRALQRIGRGTRTGVGKEKLIVVDFINLCHKWMADHSVGRLKTFQQEGCFVISESK